MNGVLTAGITDLHTSLTDVDGDDFTHLFDEVRKSCVASL